MITNQPLYNYMATVIKIVDGDTLSLLIDTGFKHTWKTNCRLEGINTPELRSEDVEQREKAQLAKQYLLERIPPGSPVYIISRRLDKYGRPIADVYFNGESINKELVSKGYAVKYP